MSLYYFFFLFITLFIVLKFNFYLFCYCEIISKRTNMINRKFTSRNININKALCARVDCYVTRISNRSHQATTIVQLICSQFVFSSYTHEHDLVNSFLGIAVNNATLLIFGTSQVVLLMKTM